MDMQVAAGPVSGLLDRAAYLDFLRGKFRFETDAGFVVDRAAINPLLKPHQMDLVEWMLRKGRAACFAAFGLGKSFIQLEAMRLVQAHTGGRCLIVLPLGVRQEFTRDAAKLGITVTFVRRSDEVGGPGLYLSNYESVRDRKLDVGLFEGASLDEASVLRGYGTKTFQEFLILFAATPFRFVATATPSPNEHKELIHYAGFLGVMDTGQALTRFFQRDSEKAGNLTLMPHMEREFWLWLHSWAAFVQKPSDLGHNDDGYVMPPLAVRVHFVKAGDIAGGVERDGQGVLIRDAALGLQQAATEKRESITARVAKMAEIVNAAPEDHFILWHDLEAERHAIKQALPEAVEVYGSLDLDKREERVIGFSDGAFRLLATKPVVSGSGCNFQRFCHRAIFLGIGYKFNDFIQAIHRIRRFLQPHQCEIDIIVCETEREVWRDLERKWKEHDALTERMGALIAEHGLSTLGLERELARTIGVARREEIGHGFTVAHNDTVLECDLLPADSQDLIITSIPFGNHYEYSACYEDFGHNQDHQRFFDQMAFLTPNLLRILKPGRILAVHVKDRIRFGNVTGMGMPTVEPFHADCIYHYRRAGFAYMGLIFVETDVVRENNQTYRLGWTEQCKDGTKMGVGSPEFILLFRKLPSDTSTAYADVPVVKTKAEYTRGRWQIDANAKWRSSGDRFLTAEEWAGYGPADLAKAFRQKTRDRLYDFAGHVAVAEALDSAGHLPSTFASVAAGSHRDDCWDDVARMRTLNGRQAQKALQQHLCLARGSLVLTGRGHVPIEDVVVGDIVLTHRGRWRPVTVKRMTGVRPVVKVNAQGVGHLLLTPDHKLWTRKVASNPEAVCHARRHARKAVPDWVEAAETVGSYVNLGLPPEARDELTDAEWWLVGRWLADGHRGTRGDFFVSIGNHKLDDFLARAGRHAGMRQVGTATQIRLKEMRPAMLDMLEQCGEGAAAKQVPVAALSLPAAKAVHLLDGYMSGDGHYLPGRRRWAATSVSRAMLLGLAMVAQRAKGAIASVYAGRAPGKSTIEGREVNTRQEWVFSFDLPDPARKNGLPFIADDGAWKKVRSVEDAGEAETWCLRVEEDESFTAEGCVVKNCPLQFDIVDRLIERYSNPGEQVFDPFGGLFTVPYCAMRLGRRGRAVELNPDYFRDGLRHLRDMEQSLATPTLFDLEGLGPAVAA